MPLIMNQQWGKSESLMHDFHGITKKKNNSSNENLLYFISIYLSCRSISSRVFVSVCVCVWLWRCLLDWDTFTNSLRWVDSHMEINRNFLRCISKSKNPVQYISYRAYLRKVGRISLCHQCHIWKSLHYCNCLNSA